MGHAWDKCCYICQRNQTCRDNSCPSCPESFSVRPDNYLQATVYVNNAPVHSGGARLIHNLFCSHSRVEWTKKKKSRLTVSPPVVEWREPFLKLWCRKYTEVQKLSFVEQLQLKWYWIASTTLWFVASHIHIGEALFFFFASTSEGIITHVPGEVTFNETPTVAEIKLKHWFPWVPLRRPSGASPGFISLSWCRFYNLLIVSSPLHSTY